MTYSTFPPRPAGLIRGDWRGRGDDLRGSRAPSSASAPSTPWRMSPSAGAIDPAVLIDSIINLENWTTQAHTIPLDTSGRLKVVLTGAGNYVCELRRGGLAQQVKFSAPIYLPEKRPEAPETTYGTIIWLDWRPNWRKRQRQFESADCYQPPGRHQRRSLQWISCISTTPTIQLS